MTDFAVVVVVVAVVAVVADFAVVVVVVVVFVVVAVVSRPLSAFSSSHCFDKLSIYPLAFVCWVFLGVEKNKSGLLHCRWESESVRGRKSV